MEDLLEMVDSLEMNGLHRAVHENRLEAVRFLVRNGANVTNSIKGRTPLHLAVSLNLSHVTRELLKYKPRKKIRNVIEKRTLDTRMTALHLAVMNNSLEITRYLLSHGATCDLIDKQLALLAEDPNLNESIKDLAKQIDIIFQSIKVHKVDRVLIDKLNSYSAEDLAALMYARDTCCGRTALQLAMTSAITMKRWDIAEAFIRLRVEKLKRYPWHSGATLDKLAQHWNAARSHFSDLERSSDRSDVMKEAENVLGNSYEFLAACKEQGDPSLDGQPLLILIEEILELFGSWQASKSRFIANAGLDMGVDNLKIAGIAKLLKLCVIAPMLFFMRSIYTIELLQAAKQNDLAKVAKCLTGQPDLNKRNVEDWTALHYALSHKNDKMAKLLLNLGADPASATNDEGERKETPLQFALRRAGEEEPNNWWIKPEVMLLLFESTSDDKMADYVDGGSSALHLAVKQDNYRLVQFLLRKGAVYSKDNVPSDYFHSRDAMIANLLETVDRFFVQARDGKIEELIMAVRELDEDTLLAVGGARDSQGYTLDRVVELKGHVDEAVEIRKLLIDSKRRE